MLAASLLACNSNRKHPIVIAAVGPLSGSEAPRGKDLQEAAQMAVDETNAAGGVNDHPVQVRVYDDADQPAQARSLAGQIASTTAALAVLGQVASSAAVAAGEVYKAQGLPAITGAASESRVTSDNEWFFRLIPTATTQGEFLADYARYRFGAHEVMVVREKGTAGDEFATAFRDHAKNEKIRVTADIEFLPADARDPTSLAALASKLGRVPKGTIIVLGTQYAETPAVLRVLRDKFGPFRAMGYSSVATEGLSKQFEAAESERHSPGYYTDGLNVAAPQLGDIAQYAQTVFAVKFKGRYGSEPNPEAVRWYEGAKLIFQAIKATGVMGSEPTSDRRRIRDWLAAMDRPEDAAAGTGGPVYFDKEHNVQRGISVGLFYEDRLISAPVQLLPVADPTKVPGYDRLAADGMVIDADGRKIVKTPVVYAGFDLNSLDNIDVRAGTFSGDFFLWLRTLDGETLDPHEVEFPTAHSGAQLGQEVMRRSYGGFTTVTYHVKGVFHAEYEFLLGRGFTVV
jgi:branched-chain amino acid transport system substrate-binding protein